jgi:predicted glutamine amidotransferase
MVGAYLGESSVIIASERLTDQKGDWVRVAPNHLLAVTPKLEVNMELVEVERRAANH